MGQDTFTDPIITQDCGLVRAIVKVVPDWAADGQIEEFGGWIDRGVRGELIKCQEVVDLYDSIAGTPTFDVPGNNETMSWAYDCYRQSVVVFLDGAKDMTGNCRDLLADPQREKTLIGFQQWGLARQEINGALGILIPAIERLEQ